MTPKNFTVLIIFSLLLAACAPGTNAPQPATVSTAESNSAPIAAESVATSEPLSATSATLTYPIVDSAQATCYDNAAALPCGTGFSGQDAQYNGNAPRYQDNGDGTVSDLVTGLMWQQSPGDKLTYAQATAGADAFTLAGYDDWRLPTIKELYSLILFDGTDVSGAGALTVTPFIDTRYFNFSYGDPAAGERTIDSQFASSTKYVSTTMNGAETLFGVNFADGRIKGYGLSDPRGSGEKTFYVLYVRGNPDYGQNAFTDNGDGTVTDTATGLTWMQADSGSGLDWQSALNYCEALDLAGSSAWRLPNAKELQSLVNYSRSPAATNSAAIDPIFKVSSITNEAGQVDYPFYWTSTTHADASGRGTFAAYVSFGRALGYMNAWVDVHGAGAQRSDPKTGSASEYPQGHGPQGDAVRIENYVRCVRGGANYIETGVSSDSRPTMQVESTGAQQTQAGEMPTNGSQPQGGMPGNGTPPQPAIEACSSSSQGAACSFTTPNGAINGSCQLIQQQLACVPANKP